MRPFMYNLVLAPATEQEVRPALGLHHHHVGPHQHLTLEAGDGGDGGDGAGVGDAHRRALGIEGGDRQIVAHLPCQEGLTFMVTMWSGAAREVHKNRPPIGRGCMARGRRAGTGRRRQSSPAGGGARRPAAWRPAGPACQRQRRSTGGWSSTWGRRPAGSPCAVDGGSSLGLGSILPAVNKQTNKQSRLLDWIRLSSHSHTIWFGEKYRKYVFSFLWSFC